MSHEVVVRRATPADAASVARLCVQLGYAASVDEAEARLRMIDSRPDQLVLLAESGGAVVAWIDLHIEHSIAAGKTVQIAGLVVDENHRGSGVGRLLMRHAEEWARSNGCSSLRLRSNIIRSQAHEFYEKLGYKVTKTQKAFAKELLLHSS
jgi:GNAT superfamily N-acetyltransferase